MKTFDDVLAGEIRELFSSQRQWLLALPGLIRSATRHELVMHLRNEARETKRHIERIEEVAELLGISPRGRMHAPVKELVDIASAIPAGEADGVISDTRLIIASQRIAHLLICGYGTTATLAKVLRHQKAEALLTTSLAEKRADDRSLTNLATDLYSASGPAERISPVLDDPFRA